MSNGLARRMSTMSEDNAPSDGIDDGQSLPQSPPPPDPNLGAALGLTPAETRVAWLIGCALRIRQVATYLGISIHTVRAHLRQIYEKTGVHSQPELVRLVMGQATQQGLSRGSNTTVKGKEAESR